MEEFPDLPNSLGEWTFDTVVSLVKKYEFEPGTFDYKDVLNPTSTDVYREEHRESIRRTVCSMANTSGGVILFGVQDRKKEVAKSEDRIVGIPIGGDLRKHFGDKIMNIQPEVYFETTPQVLPLPNNQDRGIFIVRIPKSQRRPHMVQSTGAYYRRGENGTAIFMNHYEVREQMIYTEDRLQRVNLLRLEIAQYLEIAYSMSMEQVYVVKSLYRFDTGAFKVLLADICSLVPSHLLRTLLRIPLEANLINKHVENTSQPGKPSVMEAPLHYYINDRDGILHRVSELKKLCEQCETHLENIFGPLGRAGS